MGKMQLLVAALLAIVLLTPTLFILLSDGRVVDPQDLVVDLIEFWLG